MPAPYAIAIEGGLGRGAPSSNSQAEIQLAEDVYFSAFFCAAHRVRCASPMLFRAAALSLRRFLVTGLASGDCALSFASSLRTCWSRDISESMAAMILSTAVMTGSLRACLRQRGLHVGIEKPILVISHGRCIARDFHRSYLCDLK